MKINKNREENLWEHFGMCSGPIVVSLKAAQPALRTIRCCHLQCLLVAFFFFFRGMLGKLQL